MRYLLRRVRFFFILTALGFGSIGIGLLALPSHRPSHHPFRILAGGIAFSALAVVYAVAWWTTRKRTPYRNNWAVAASVFNLLLVGGNLWITHFDLATHPSQLLGVIVALGGLYAYGTGGAPPKAGDALPESVPASAVRAQPVALAGDRIVPWARHVATAVSLAGEYAAIYYWSHWARENGLLHTGRLPWYVLFTIAVLITTVLHECGHWLFAWCFHMRLLSFNAGPLRFRKREGKWSFRIAPEGIVDLGGAVRVVPTHSQQPRMHDVLMIAAGPLINVITGAFLLISVLYSDWPHYDITWRLVAFTASFSFLAAVVNLIPFRTADGGYSDGAQIVQILTNSPVYEYNRTINSISAMLVTQRRFRDLDVNSFHYAAEQFPFTERAFLMQLFISHYYLDADRPADARKALTQAENIVSQAGIDVAGPLHTALIFDQAYLNRNAAAARSWWDRMEAKKVERKSFDYWLAKAALHWIEGSAVEANEAWKLAESEAARLPQFGAYEFDRHRLQLLRQAMDDPKTNLRPVPVVPQPAPVSARGFTPAVRAAVATASSRAIAEAASSPAVPAQQQFDPLSFIRGARGAEPQQSS